MVVVLSARVGRLVAGDAVDVDAVHELELREDVERAVDAREADGLAPAAQPVVDVLGAQAAVLAGEQREHLLAGAPGTVPGARQLAMRVVGPGGHARMVAPRTANENDFQ